MKSTLTQLTTPLLIGEDIEQKRLELKNYFANTWQSYESLFALINDEEAYYLRPERLRHPLIFYYGHTATFYINKLILGKYISTRLNEKLEAVCAVGVDEMSWDDLDSNHYQWPSLSEVKTYRQQVFELVNQLIDDMPLTLPISQDSLAWVILMGCEHERIHLETSSVIMRMLPLKYLSSTSHWLACSDVNAAPDNALLKVSGETVTLGKASDDYTYGWDNEYGQLTITVSPFKASKYLVSNQEFLHFVEAGGYHKPEFWNEEGKQWLSFTLATMPKFWLTRGNEYWQRNLLTEIPLPLNWPVEVNYLEANAFCHWKSKQTQGYIRLPTEAEWYCLRTKLSQDKLDSQTLSGNINLTHYASSCPIDTFEHQGFYDVIGNVWQWTESAIDGFEGFSVHPLYDDFSTPTFDGQHNLIKGGSWISTGNETLQSSRYAFRRHFFQHAGFRYVESDQAKAPIIPVNPIETDEVVCQQLASQYPTSQHQGANFSVELANVVQAACGELYETIASGKLLNLGCSVGRTAFELSTLFDQIDAVDFSARFIQYGVKLQNDENVRFQSIVEGDIVHFNEVSLAKYVKNYRANVNFYQGDAVNLKPIFQGYDVILLQQVLEQSYDPKAVLENMTQRLNSAGLLIVATNNTFKEEITPKEKWLGGVKVNGENVTVFDGLSQLLLPNFNLVSQTTLQQTVATNAYQNQQSHIMVSVWQLKNDE
jgi:5-histidylcysteine sulfoxide synthase/putative 4-mercaptohistidine N1-methyltranferase